MRTHSLMEAGCGSVAGEWSLEFAGTLRSTALTSKLRPGCGSGWEEAPPRNRPGLRCSTTGAFLCTWLGVCRVMAPIMRRFFLTARLGLTSARDGRQSADSPTGSYPRADASWLFFRLLGYILSSINRLLVHLMEPMAVGFTPGVSGAPEGLQAAKASNLERIISSFSCQSARASFLSFQ